MNEAKLEEIKARARAASHGPWRLSEVFWSKNRGTGNQRQTVHPRGEGGAVATAHHAYRSSFSHKVKTKDDKDAVFIAHAREDVPNLVEELEKIRALLQKAMPHAPESLQEDIRNALEN